MALISEDITFSVCHSLFDIYIYMCVCVCGTHTHSGYIELYFV